MALTGLEALQQERDWQNEHDAVLAEEGYSRAGVIERFKRADDGRAPEIFIVLAEKHWRTGKDGKASVRLLINEYFDHMHETVQKLLIYDGLVTAFDFEQQLEAAKAK